MRRVNWSTFLFIAFIAMSSSGCAFLTEEVPMGFVGMVQTPSGLSGGVLQAGHHLVFGRDKIYLIELSEQVKNEHLKILCLDDLNFSFDLKIRARLKVRDAKGVKDVLTRLGSKMKARFKSSNSGNMRVMRFQTLYNTFVRPQARALARTIVSKYSTTQIRENREKIQKAIYISLKAALKGTPMEVPMVAASNFDYPDIVTKAMEKKREREIAIGQEKAKQAMELLRAQNRLKIAQKMMAVRATEAKAEAIYYKIIGQSLTPLYLRMRNLENQLKLYSNVGPGDKVIVTGSQGVRPLIQIPPSTKK